MADFVDAKLNQPGLIYIIQEGTSDYFKVGASENEQTVKLRVSNLQSGNWRKLTLIQTHRVSNMKLAEDEAHRSLKQVHVQAGGGREWFNSSRQTIEDAVNAAARKYPNSQIKVTHFSLYSALYAISSMFSLSRVFTVYGKVIISESCRFELAFRFVTVMYFFVCRENAK